MQSKGWLAGSSGLLAMTFRLKTARIIIIICYDQAYLFYI